MDFIQLLIVVALDYVWNLVFMKSKGWPTITWDQPAASPHIKSLKVNNEVGLVYIKNNIDILKLFYNMVQL